MSVQTVVDAQREFFNTGATLPVKFRLDALTKLERAIKARESEICDALAADLGKSRFESYMCEIGLVLSEISYMKKHLKRYAKPRRVPMPLAQFHAAGFEMPSPYGVVLVMSPWNYPFMLAVEPAVDALAAGNTVVIKPGAYAVRTSAVLARLFASCLPEQLVSVVQGGHEVNTTLLDTKFDYIFFTGGKVVGQIVMRKAAEHLTPVSLELGGKSPCIVDETADLKLAAKRIVFGKFLNLGQTCVAPDYVLVHESVKNDFLIAVKSEIRDQFGARVFDNENYGKIINEKHFERLLKLFKDEDIVCGGEYDAEKLRIAPTVLANVSMQSPCMQEEIFGPVLPVLEYKTQEDVENVIARNPTPLALYYFTAKGKKARAFMQRVQFGGGCINDTIIHLANSATGFGGVGSSGMGAYHGKKGFDTFTHYKSVVDKKTWLDLPFRYQPYSAFKEKLIRLFLR